MSNDRKYLTPQCSTIYQWLFEPNKNFKKEDGEYSITCFTENTKEWNEIINSMKQGYEEFYKAQCSIRNKKTLKKCEHFPWKKFPDGRDVFVAKNNGAGEKDGKKFYVKITVVAGNPPQPITQADMEGFLGEGTIARVGFTANYWYNDAQGVGVSARLSLVHLIKPQYRDSLGGFGDLLKAQPLAEENYWFPVKKVHTEPAKDESVPDADFMSDLQNLKKA